jgi:hypothetical protein
MHTKFWSESLERRDYSEDLGIDVKIIMDTGERRWESVDWIHLAQDRELWWTLVNMVMKLWVL